jgi:hypothetical protein
MKEETTEAMVPSDVENGSEQTAIQVRQPLVPIGLDDLSSLEEKGLMVIKTRIKILKQLREGSIAATHPEDWVKFKDREGRVVCFLSDSGCKRIWQLWNIQIYDIGEPLRIEFHDQRQVDGRFHFMYKIKGSARCGITGGEILDVWGGRDSTEEFCREKTGAKLELDVQKAARANLDGTCLRKLVGLESVPEEELRRCNLDTSRCRLGKGFGTRVERDLQIGPSVPMSELPSCPKCMGPMKLVQGGTSKQGKPYGPFLACKKPKDQCGGTRTWGPQNEATAQPAREPDITAEREFVKNLFFGQFIEQNALMAGAELLANHGLVVPNVKTAANLLKTIDSAPLDTLTLLREEMS